MEGNGDRERLDNGHKHRWKEEVLQYGGGLWFTITY
jgi:hypothetical protein